MKNNIFDLTGQVALVAGGSSGLGLQFAKAMANAGANVAIVARRTDRLEKNAKEIAAEYGVEVYPHYLDLCDSKSVTKCVEDVIAHFGKIDILVNSGGTGGSSDPATMTDEQWAHVVDTDLTGLFYLCRDVARLSMIPNNYGRIVNVSSIHGFVSRKNVWTAPYCASKGGEINAFDHIIGIAAVGSRAAACTQRGRHDRRCAAAAAEEHIAKFLRRGGQHTDLLIAAVGGDVHVAEGMVHGKRLVSTRKHETCSYDQQPKKNTSGRKRLPPAEPTLQRARFPQRKAEDRHRQRYQQQKDCRKVPADAVKELRGKICDNISAHADLVDGHEVSEDHLINQLHLGKQHLRGYQKESRDLPRDAGQARDQQGAEHAAQQTE